MIDLFDLGISLTRPLILRGSKSVKFGTEAL